MASTVSEVRKSTPAMKDEVESATTDLVDKWMRIASEKAGQLDDALRVMLDVEDDIFGHHPEDALEKLRRFLAAVAEDKPALKDEVESATEMQELYLNTKDDPESDAPPSPTLKDEVYAILAEYLPHGTGEVQVRQLWPVLEDAVKWRKR